MSYGLMNFINKERQYFLSYARTFVRTLENAEDVLQKVLILSTRLKNLEEENYQKYAHNLVKWQALKHTRYPTHRMTSHSINIDDLYDLAATDENSLELELEFEEKVEQIMEVAKTIKGKRGELFRTFCLEPNRELAFRKNGLNKNTALTQWRLAVEEIRTKLAHTGFYE